MLHSICNLDSKYLLQTIHRVISDVLNVTLRTRRELGTEHFLIISQCPEIYRFRDIECKIVGSQSADVPSVMRQ